MGRVFTTYIKGWCEHHKTTGEGRGRTDFRRNGDAEEVDEANVLIPDDLDLIDQTEPAEIIPQLFFSRVLI